VNGGVKLIVPIATGLRSEGHWRGVTRGVQDDRAHRTVAARCGIGRVDQRGPSTREPGLHSWTAAILSEAVGRLTAGVAHDFNNPQMSIGGSGRVDRDAAFLRSGVRPVPIMQSTGVTIRAVTQSCYPICDRYSTCCLPQRDHEPTIYVGR
jgi:hypothetical protein